MPSILCIYKRSEYEKLRSKERQLGAVVDVAVWMTQHPRFQRVGVHDAVYIVTVRPDPQPRIWLVAILRDPVAGDESVEAEFNQTPTVDVTELVLSLKFLGNDKPIMRVPAKYGNSLQVPRFLTDEDCAQLEAVARAGVPSGGPTPSDPKFGKRRMRPGQGEFRDLLMAKLGKCVISGETLVELLEAAHIHPYAAAADDTLANGLLLRADLHALFDADLLAVDPVNRRVAVHPRVQSPQYRDLDGRRLGLPSKWPLNREALERRWTAYQAKLSSAG